MDATLLPTLLLPFAIQYWVYAIMDFSVENFMLNCWQFRDRRHSR
jgi:hypothetical protein